MYIVQTGFRGNTMTVPFGAYLQHPWDALVMIDNDVRWTTDDYARWLHTRVRVEGAAFDASM